MDDFFTVDQPTPPSSSNGLPAQAWVAIGAIDPRLAEPLLSTLGSAGVGAYVAPFTSRQGSHLEMRLWVDASLRTEAERVVAASLPEMRESLAETEDERWSAIVASLQSSDADADKPWPDIEGYTSLSASGPDPSSYDEEPPAPTYDEEEHFVPPDPTPLPPSPPLTRYGWMALLGGIALLVIPALFGHAIGSGLLAIGILAVIGGFLTLVMQLKDGPPADDGPDDGAVV
jgi:hypothetical protein